MPNAPCAVFWAALHPALTSARNAGGTYTESKLLSRLVSADTRHDSNSYSCTSNKNHSSHHDSGSNTTTRRKKRQQNKCCTHQASTQERYPLKDFGAPVLVPRVVPRILCSLNIRDTNSSTAPLRSVEISRSCPFWSLGIAGIDSTSRTIIINNSVSSSTVSRIPGRWTFNSHLLLIW